METTADGTGRDEGVRDHLLAEKPDDVALCSVVRAELLFGARKSERVEENLERLARFFQPSRLAPFDDHAAEHYGIVRTQLERAGTPIGSNELMIAAIALARELTLVTRNVGEFRRVPGLRVATW